jgi:tRNA(Ile)-lysidine synthase
VRLRKAKTALAALGLTPGKISLSARRLERARSALDHAAAALETDARLDVHGGAYASLDTQAFLAAPEDVRRRLLSRLIAAFGGQSEPVRLAKLESLAERLDQPESPAMTLGGAMVARRAREVIVHREPGRGSLPEIQLAPGEAADWDGRFRVGADRELAAPVLVAPLGRAGFAQLHQQLERAPRMPARAAATLPAFWQQGALLAVPALASLPWPDAASSNQARLCRCDFLW